MRKQYIVCATKDKWAIYLNTRNLQFNHQQKDAMYSFRVTSLARKTVEAPEECFVEVGL